MSFFVCFLFFAEMGNFHNFWGIKGNERFSREFEPVTKGKAGWRLAGIYVDVILL